MQKRVFLRKTYRDMSNIPIYHSISSNLYSAILLLKKEIDVEGRSPEQLASRSVSTLLDLISAARYAVLPSFRFGSDNCIFRSRDLQSIDYFSMRYKDETRYLLGLLYSDTWPASFIDFVLIISKENLRRQTSEML